MEDRTERVNFKKESSLKRRKLLKEREGRSIAKILGREMRES